MALLPDPTDHLSAADRAEHDRMAAVRSHADGRTDQALVYALMFNEPGVATRVGALGEHLRFGGVLPDDVRELCILRYASRKGYGYEWAHHQRPARQAGLDATTLTAVTADEEPDGLRSDQRAALAAVDAVAADRTLTATEYTDVVDAFGPGGAVELVVLCGLYALMGAMTTAFDIEVEPGLPVPPNPPF